MSVTLAFTEPAGSPAKAIYYSTEIEDGDVPPASWQLAQDVEFPGSGQAIVHGLDPETAYYFSLVIDGGLNAGRSALTGIIGMSVETPVITITTQPSAHITVTAGSISGSLTIAADVTASATLSYQWYSDATAVTTGGTAIGGATGASFAIPTGLTAGTYYYFCEVSATGGATPVRSTVATVTVNPAGPPPTPPTDEEIPITITIVITNADPTLPEAKVGEPYSAQLYSSPISPVTWSLESGSLPPGLTLSVAGVISGTPTTAGLYTFTVRASTTISSSSVATRAAISSSPVIIQTTSGSLSTIKTFQLTVTGAVGNEEIGQPQPLRAWAHNGMLHVSGLVSGEFLNVYNYLGILIRHDIAVDSEVNIPLSIRGVYIIKSGNRTTKVIN